MKQVILLTGIWDSMPSRTLGAYLLKHCLIKRGFSTQVIDYCQEFTAPELFELIDHFIGPDTVCIGASSTFWSDDKKVKRKNSPNEPPEVMIEVFSIIKNKYPNIKIVVGGAGVRHILSGLGNIDCFVTGNAEDTFPELLMHWTAGTQSPQWKLYKNKKVFTAPITKTYDISKCDFEWDDSDCIIENETLAVEMARGCIFKCKFCSYPHLGKKKFDYIRDLSYVRQHLIRNYEKWGTTNYIMLDDTFNDSEYKIDSFLEMTKSLPFKISFWAYIRADLLHRFTGMAEKLLEAGLVACTIGIETTGIKASTIIGKGWSGKEAKEYVPHLVHNIWQDKVNVMISIIVGLPGDTRQDCEDTFNWINENNLSAAFTGLVLVRDDKHPLSPYISEFEANYEKYGINKTNTGTWESAEWSTEEAAKVAARYTINRKIKQHHSMLNIFATNFGYSIDEIMHDQDVDIKNSERFRKELSMFIDKYKNKLLSL